MKTIILLTEFYNKYFFECMFIIHFILAVIFYIKGGKKKIFKWPFGIEFEAFEYFASVSLFIVLGRILGCL